MDLAVVTLLCAALACPGCLCFRLNKESSRRNKLISRSATNHLVYQNGSWFLDGLRGGILRKVVGQGRGDCKGIYRGITDNKQGHIFHNPPPDFVTYLLSLPVMYDEKRLYYNGTDFLVRPMQTSEWRPIVLEGLQNADSALHVFDNVGQWYRFPNGSELWKYLAKMPKALAVCDNYLSERSGDEWGIRKRNGIYRSLTHIGEIIANLRCENGKNSIWFTVRNPSKEVLDYMLKIPLDVYDPYNLSLSDVPMIQPTVLIPKDNAQST